MKLLIIIPAYNEEESIKYVVEDLKKKCSWCDYVVVNDGSVDNTYNICMHNGYNCINLPINLGLTGAFVTGMKYAYIKGYDAVIQFDADGQHLSEHIEDLFNCYQKENYDVIIGSRFVNKKKPFSPRMIGSKLISFAIRVTTGEKITDPTSGMRLWGKKIIKEFATEINMTPEPDTVAYLIKRGAKIKEVQVEMKERMAGQSYLTFAKSILYMTRMLISILVVQFFRGGNKLEKSEGIK